MLVTIRTASTLFLLFTALTGFAYPFLVTIVAQAFFHHQANGSVLIDGHRILGSDLLGQPFHGDTYFWSRPSATSPFAYNAGSSSGSNLGPTNPSFLKAVQERIAVVKKTHPDQSGAVPGDMVTASASGLDPHISPAAAEYQSYRVARARALALEQVRKLIVEHTEDRTVGLFGERRVHVLKLNLALDAAEK